MDFQGRLLQGGQVVLERVAGTMHGRTRADGSAAWSGTFLLPPGRFLAFGDYTLHLDDGTSPGIRLNSVAADPSVPTLAAFKVSGSLGETPAD